MFEQVMALFETVKLSPGALIFLFSAYKYFRNKWAERKAGKIGRLELLIHEIELIEESPARLPAIQGEILSAILWVLIGLLSEVSILVIPPATRPWEQLFLAIVISLLFVLFILLLLLYVRTCQRHGNPVKYKALLENQIAMLRLKHYDTALRKESRMLTPDELSIQIVPCKALKSPR